MKKTSSLDKLADFIYHSPNALLATDNAAERLLKNGYSELFESKPFDVKPGGKYFIKRNNSSIIAFALPKKTKNVNFQILAAHSDSPALRVKKVWKLNNATYLMLNAEKYGGGIWITWMDRPLSLAGRVTVRQKDGSIRLLSVNIDKDLMMLPSLAIHFNREINDGMKIEPQRDLCPVLSLNTSLTLESLIAEAAGCEPEEIVSHELTVYCRNAPLVWGAEKEFFSSPRLDDQMCAFGGLEALLQSSDSSRTIRVFACFDNEEIGCSTRHGPAGTFLDDTLRRLATALGYTQEEYLCALAKSYLLSADNAHAFPQTHNEKCDPTNRVYMNKGVVLKHAVAYSTDGTSDGILRSLCEKHGIPLQDYSNNSNEVGGGTLANIASLQLNIRMADIGIPQLAMHSAFETAGARDIDNLVTLVVAFFNETLTETAPDTFAWVM